MASWFIIENDASGNMFFMDIERKGCAVLLWDDETHELFRAVLIDYSVCKRSTRKSPLDNKSIDDQAIVTYELHV